MTTPSLPAGHDVSAALFWAGFHLQRNLKKRAFHLWAVAFVLIIGLLKFGGRASADVIASTLLLALIPLSTLFFATGAMREEIEDQTLTYSFTRPVSRVWLFAARVAAATAPVLILSVAIGLLIGLSIGPQTALRFAIAAGLGSLAFSGLFSLIGQLLRHPTWLGLAYFLFWEGAVGSVPGFLGRLTLGTHIRAIAELRPQSAFGFAWEMPPLVLSATVLIGFTIVTLALGGFRVRSREQRLIR